MTICVLLMHFVKLLLTLLHPLHNKTEEQDQVSLLIERMMINYVICNLSD